MWSERTVELPESLDVEPTSLALWSQQQRLYDQMWTLYTGERWQEIETSIAGARELGVLRYRLQVNDIAYACLTHAYALYGEVPDSMDPLLRFRIESRRGFVHDTRPLQDTLDEIWYENNPRQNQYRAGLLSQITGGCVWRIRFDLNRSMFDLYPFRIEPLDPSYFYPIFAPGSTEPVKVIIRYRLSRQVATALWGKTLPSWSDMVIYHEEWTAQHYLTKVGGPGAWAILQDEPNVFGLIPFEYIPHILGRGFYGLPLAQWAQGLVEEYNARLANLADLARQAAVRLGVLKGHSNGRDLASRLYELYNGGPFYVDLGQNVSTDRDPELAFEEPPSITPALMAMVEKLQADARLSMFIPAIAVGQDEGSQRSGTTLFLRMWPLQGHINTERWLHGSAMERFCRKLLYCAKIKRRQFKNGEVLADIDLATVRITPDWAPVLPRDREQLTNELVMRASVGHVDRETALRHYGDIPEGEITTVLNRIEEAMTAQAATIANAPNPLPVTGG